ncbi:hypothetical protein DMB35_02280 [Acinetobacter baumannii A424]|nr:hypothetical protein DMB35_02280 [Acinetobacter baumannii A424]
MENLYFFNERNKYLKDIKYLIFLLLQNSIEDASIEHQKLISMSVRILNNGVLYKMDFSSLISFKNELISFFFFIPCRCTSKKESV